MTSAYILKTWGQIASRGSGDSRGKNLEALFHLGSANFHYVRIGRGAGARLARLAFNPVGKRSVGGMRFKAYNTGHVVGVKFLNFPGQFL